MDGHVAIFAALILGVLFAAVGPTVFGPSDEEIEKYRSAERTREQQRVQFARASCPSTPSAIQSVQTRDGLRRFVICDGQEITIPERPVLTAPVR